MPELPRESRLVSNQLQILQQIFPEHDDFFGLHSDFPLHIFCSGGDLADARLSVDNAFFAGLQNCYSNPVIEVNASANALISFILANPSAKPAVLDSCARTLGDSRYLVAAVNPTESGEIFCQTSAEALSALEFLEQKLHKYSARSEKTNCASLEKFNGICVVTFSYDFGLLFENIGSRHLNGNVSEPSISYAFYETVFVHDYQVHRTFVLGNAAEKAAAELKSAEKIFFESENIEAARIVSNFSRESYCAAVEQILRHIALGDIYQANLTQQFRAELPSLLTPETIFRRLREQHPAPFAAFIRRENDCVVSASPERFLRVSDAKIVTAQPIKGTRPRGENEFEDLRLRRELAASRKDRAENVMIVDLLRNDIGRVCKFGSVRAEKLCEIEEHPTLFHMVSTVRGELKNNVAIGDLLKAAFPCGSITGAPKISAMRILDEIETAPRGLSMGAVGYLSFNGEMDFNVAIRTMVVRENQAIFNVGGGIVFDSSPAAEYEESLVKAKALFKALGASF